MQEGGIEVNEKLVSITGHLLPEEPVAGYGPPKDKSLIIRWTCVFQPRQKDELEKRLLKREKVLSHEEFRQTFSPDRDFITRAEKWLTRHGVESLGHEDCLLKLKGTMQQIEDTLGIVWGEKDVFFMLLTEPKVPDWLAENIVGFVGLENVSRLYPRFRFPSRSEQLANNGQGFFPQNIKTAYDFPAQWDGSGTTIGLLEFSNGYSQTDVTQFWNNFGIPTPSLLFVSVDGTPNDNGVHGYDMEATLDVEWTAAMAPGAKVVVYESSAGTSDTSFALSVLHALQYAYQDTVNKPDVLSISYGDGETRFPVSTMQAWDSVAKNAAAVGITVFVASGDEGAYGLHGPGKKICRVDAPANCPHMVAAGGTHLVLDTQGQIAIETGWTDTNHNGASGGGISQVFSVPSYQEAITLPVKPGYRPGRGVPDVALNADPDTGYAIFFQGAWTVVGGTSVASPIWAALMALINQMRAKQGKPTQGYANPQIYALDQKNFRAITVGNNSYDGVIGYQCTPGWNAVTGWGSPLAMALANNLS